jgi:hypothetical protein
VTVTKDTVNDRVDVGLGGTTWPTSTITARYAAYYKARGGASSADELVALIDFGANDQHHGGNVHAHRVDAALANQNP